MTCNLIHQFCFQIPTWKKCIGFSRPQVRLCQSKATAIEKALTYYTRGWWGWGLVMSQLILSPRCAGHGLQTKRWRASNPGDHSFYYWHILAQLPRIETNCYVAMSENAWSIIIKVLLKTFYLFMIILNAEIRRQEAHHNTIWYNKIFAFS